MWKQLYLSKLTQESQVTGEKWVKSGLRENERCHVVSVHPTSHSDCCFCSSNWCLRLHPASTGQSFPQTPRGWASFHSCVLFPSGINLQVTHRCRRPAQHSTATASRHTLLETCSAVQTHDGWTHLSNLEDAIRGLSHLAKFATKSPCWGCASADVTVSLTMWLLSNTFELLLL